MRVTRYRFIGVRRDDTSAFGRIRIAEVSVVVELGACAADVEYDVSGVPWWKEAATLGARRAIAAGGARALHGSCRVVINDVVDFPADSTPDSVESAAFVATWLAVGGNELDLTRSYADGVWRVDVAGGRGRVGSGP